VKGKVKGQRDDMTDERKPTQSKRISGHAGECEAQNPARVPPSDALDHRKGGYRNTRIGGSFSFTVSQIRNRLAASPKSKGEAHQEEISQFLKEAH
jgi:hypothetical protein